MLIRRAVAHNTQQKNKISYKEKRGVIMNNKLYVMFSSLILVCCTVEEQAFPEQVVISSPPTQLYSSALSTATILKKRTLPKNREEYHARFTDGREITFTTDSPLHYQVGDEVILPNE